MTGAPPAGPPVSAADGPRLPDAEALTVEELAARTGTTVRTVRFYASEGLLPPPQRRGRLAYYDIRHRLRLDLVRSLQEHGYTLAAISRVLARIPADASAAEYAVQAAVLAPWLPDQTVEWERTELDRRAGRRLTDAELEFLTEVGALERLPGRSGERFRAAPALLGQAVELLDLPVPPAALRESADIVRTHAVAVADGLTELFARAIWGPYQRGELDSEQVVQILARMRPLALQGLVGAFARAADAAAHRRLEQ